MSEVVEKELPKDWERTELGNIGKARMGKTILAKDLSDSGIPVYSAGADESEWGYVEESNLLFNEETIVIAARGNIGMPKLPKKFPFVSTQTTIAISLDQSSWRKWIYYYLKSYNFNPLISQTTIPMITVKQVKEISVPVAPLDQQKCIVAKIEELFSHIDAGIDALKKTKQLLEQYRQSVLKAAVTGDLSKDWRQENGVNYDKTWQPLVLGDVADIIDPNPSHRYPPYDNGDVPLLATKQMVGDDDWDESTAKLTTTEFYEKRKSLHDFKSDDIIFARKGRLGLARRPPKLNRYAFSHTVFIVRGKTDVNSNYLLWFLRREEVISWLLMEINVAAGVPTLGKAIFKKLPLLLPGKEEQKVIAEQVEEKIAVIRRTTESIEIQLKKAETNKQSILASAFTGKIHYAS